MTTPTKFKHTFPGKHDIFRNQLSNGVTLLSRANFNNPSIYISGYLPAGSIVDPDERQGLASFAASMLTRGTRNREFQEIHDSLESSGANLGFNSGVHSCNFSGRCLAEDLPMLLDILADCLRYPSFKEDQIEKLRAQFLTGLAMRAQDTREMASLTFDQILFEGHPYSRPGDGFPETVKAIEKSHLMDIHRMYYGPKGMVISIVGAVEPEKANELVERILGDWENKSQVNIPELPFYSPLSETKSREVQIKGKFQSDLVIGSTGPKRKDQDYLPASLGNSIFGQFGLMGRIGDVVRERSGLAYYAYSSLNAGHGPGSWEISAGVNPANIQKATDLIKKEISKISSAGVLEEELKDVQDNFIGRLPISLESNGGVSSALINIERFDLGMDYYMLYSDEVRQITIEDVHKVVQKYLNPDQLAIAIAGP